MTTDPTIPSEKLPRAKAKVYEYLKTYFGDEPCTRLPTTKAVAAHVRVSISTVQAVYSALAAQRIIRSEVGNGTFLVRSSAGGTASSLRLGITFGFSEEPAVTEPWHLAVCGSLLAQAAYRDRNLEIIPMQVDPQDVERMREVLSTNERSIDGVVIRSIVSLPAQISELIRPSLPYVTLRPETPNSTRNFVAPDFFATGFRMGKAFLASGRKRILFVHTGDPELAANSSLICSGLVAALGNALLADVRFGITSVPSDSEQEVEDLLGGVWNDPELRPDALCTRNVKITSHANYFFKLHGVECPREVSMIGTDDNVSPNTSRPGLTVVQQNTETLADRVLDLLVRRIERDGEDQPGIYVPERFAGFASTLPAENDVLSAPPLSPPRTKEAASEHNNPAAGSFSRS